MAVELQPHFVSELLRKDRLKSLTMERKRMIARSAIGAFFEAKDIDLAGPGPGKPT